MQANATWPGFTEVSSEAQRAAHIAHLSNLLHHPFVALADRQNAPVIMQSGEDGILFQDLRGVECYAQPDCFVVCGAPDTIPILLLTKSTEPITDIDLRLNFSEGLEFSTFAYVESGNAVLDITNDANPEAPVFNLDEISLDGGAVVIYVGARAQCDIDVINAPPTITYNLDYTAAGTVCNDEVTPPTYGGQVAAADVRFAPVTSLATIRALGETPAGCLDIPLLSLDPKAAAGEMRLLVSNYGFEDGVRIYDVLGVGDVSVPGAATIDGTGLATIDVPGSALDVDGDGFFGAGDGAQTVQICFAIDACPVETRYDIDLAMGVSCDGESCGPINQFRVATLAITPAFNPVALNTFALIQDRSYCGPDGDPEPYIFETTVNSNISTPIEGDLYDLAYSIDFCPEAFLSLSRVIIVDDAGTEIAELPSEISSQADDGRITVDLQLLDDTTIDIDGAGGLADIDGDGFANDLPAGESLTIRVELLPSCGGTTACPAEPEPGDDPLVCDFSRQRWLFARNCEATARTSRALNIADDGIVPVDNSSTASFDNSTTFVVRRTDVDGYNFEQSGDFGGNTGVVTDELVSFTYNLGNPDFAACDGDNFALVVTVIGPDTLTDDLMFTMPTFDGVAVADTDTTDQKTPGLRIYTINVGSAAAGSDMSYSFIAAFDQASCLPITTLDVSASLVQQCEGCSCAITRACSSTVFVVNPETTENCSPGSSVLTLCNLSSGYTDRTLTTKIPFDDPLIAADKKRFVPGDTIRLSGAYVVEKAEFWNSITNLLNLSVRHSELAGSVNIVRNNLTSRIDVPNARLQSLVLKRMDGTTYDLGMLAVPGGRSTSASSANSTQGGATVGGNTSPDSEADHPGLSNDFRHFDFYNSTNDHSDNALLAVQFGQPQRFPSDPDALAPLFDLIGGAFEDGDSICIVYDVPLISTPRIMEDGTAPAGPLNLTTGHFALFASANNFEGGLVTTSLSGTPRISDQYFFWEPTVELTSTLNYTDNCNAEIIQRFEMTNTPPDDWFTNQFKPTLGLEELETRIPMPYAIAGDITYQHFDQPLVVVLPDSTSGLDTAAYTGGDALVPVSVASGSVHFIDAEFTDGLRADDYVGWDQGDDDATLVGGTFPLIGVGLGTTDADPDFLEFRIPLIRLCGTATQDLPLASTFSASYRYLGDYNNNGYRCNNGQWYGANTRSFCVEAGLGRFYWPWDRESDENPHHLANSLEVPTTEVGAIPVNYTSTGSGFADPLVVDAAGTETNTYTLSLGSAIPGGTLVITSEAAVDLQTVNGVAPTLVSTTADGTTYTFDLGPLPAGDQTLDFVTDLVFCGPGKVCVVPVLGCPTDPAQAALFAEVIASSGKQCAAGEETCFSYLSGISDAVLNFDAPSPVSCGAAQTYTLTIQNIGGSDISNPVATIFQPAGLTITNLMASLDGGAPTAFTLPTAGTETVYGVQMSSAAGDLPGIPEGSTLVITFDGMLACDFLYGNPLTAQLTGDAACDREYESPFVSTVPLIPGGLTPPSLSIEPNMADINCSEGGGQVVITSVNTGKSASGPTSVCISLPEGLEVTAEDLTVLAPEGFAIADFASASLGDGTQISFSGPADLAVGAIFCLEVNFNVGDIDCGPVDVGYNIKVDQDIPCSPTDCGPVAINATSPGLLTFNVIPEAGNLEATVSAGCSDTPGNVMLNFSVDVSNSGADYADRPVTVEAFFDLDNDGLADVTLGDVSLGTVMENITLANGAMTTVNGSFEVVEDMACAIVLVVQSPSCTCSETVIPFNEVLPEFLTDLGDEIVICPGEAFTIEGICLESEFAFTPASAGTIDDSVDGEVTIEVNPGFEGIPVRLTATSTVGTCIGQTTEINVIEVQDLDFGPYEVTLCDDGCQIVDLGVSAALQRDLMVSISSDAGITDPTSFEPEFCAPITPGTRTVTFSLQDGLCTSTADLEVIVVEPPSIELAAATSQCQTGFALQDLATITPATLDGTWATSGDGTFDSSATFSEALSYVPGPADIAAQEVTLTLRTDNPDGPCGIQRASAEVTILLVDCGSFMWDGSNR
jgi:hypothetical protein